MTFASKSLQMLLPIVAVEASSNGVSAVEAQMLVKLFLNSESSRLLVAETLV